MVNTTDALEEEEEDPEFATYVVVLFGILIAIVIIFGIAGNILTILAYIRDKQLHSVYNLYLLNLSITDLLLSTISMPFYAVYTLQTYTWPFGYHFCKVYMVSDFTLCLESVLMIIIITLDRLLLLQLGPHYTLKITTTKAFIQILISWLVAFLFYSPAIIGWDIWTGENVVEDEDCDVQFAYNTTFTTITSVIEFGVPFICIVIFSCIIYYKIRKRNVVSQQPPSQTSGTMTQSNKPKRDVKAAKFLAALVIVFFVTWAPYTITTIIISFCDECVNENLYEFLNWVLWSKAALNPFLYAYNSSQFRRNFEKMVPVLKFCKTPIPKADNRTQSTNASS